MGISINVDLGRINKKFGPNAKKVAEYAIANQAMLDMERFVPLRDGDLRGSGHVSGNQIVYNTVYARAQFYDRPTTSIVALSLASIPLLVQVHGWDLKAKGMYGDKWADKGREALGL